MSSTGKDHSIVQAEAAAACVGIILLALVIVIVVVVIIILRMRHKMKERSEFMIHVSRNFNDFSQDKESTTSVGDVDKNSLKERAISSELERKMGGVGADDSPFHEQVSSFIQPAVAKEATGGFTNPHVEPTGKCSSSSSETSISKLEEPPQESGNAYVIMKDDIQVSPETTPSKPLVAPRTPPQPMAARRPAPMLPVIKPKPSSGPAVSTDKPLVPDKPPVSAKPPRGKQPVLPPKPAKKEQNTSVKPETKPKPSPRRF